MSRDTKELIEICEQLPAVERAEVANFARFLLAKNADAAARRQSAERWLAQARGVAMPGVSTDELMASTRGEP